MYTPINRIDYNDVLEKRQSKYFMFSSHIKEKYQLNNDILKIINLLTFEEVLALKIEKSIDLFNGKYILPFKDIYQNYIYKSLYILMNAYDDKKVQRKIRSLLILNRRSKYKFTKMYSKRTYQVEYDKSL